MRVARLRSSPVKGLAQREVQSLALVPGGVEGDRRFVCVDEQGRRLYSLDLGPLARATATWDRAADTLEIRFADGSVLRDAVDLAGDELELRSSSGRRLAGRLIRGPFAPAISEAAGRSLRLVHVPVGEGSPGPVTLLGDGSVARLAEELGLDALDPRRFKMSVELEGVAAHAEDEWAGRSLRVGDAVLEVGGQVPRCALTTRDPDTGERDLDTLRVLLRYRGPMATGEPPFGVYAAVREPGAIAVGDAVELL